MKANYWYDFDRSKFKIQHISRNNNLYTWLHPYIHNKNIQLHYNNEMFNNTSTVWPSQKATVIVTNYMGTLVLFLVSVQGA